MMKLILSAIFLISSFTSCQNAAEKSKVTKSTTDFQQPAIAEGQDSQEVVIHKEMPGDTAAEIKSAYRLALTSNALQLVNGETGSTTEITFGKPLEQMVETQTKFYKAKLPALV